MRDRAFQRPLTAARCRSAPHNRIIILCSASLADRLGVRCVQLRFHVPVQGAAPRLGHASSSTSVWPACPAPYQADEHAQGWHPSDAVRTVNGYKGQLHSRYPGAQHALSRCLSSTRISASVTGAMAMPSIHMGDTELPPNPTLLALGVPVCCVALHYQLRSRFSPAATRRHSGTMQLHEASAASSAAYQRIGEDKKYKV